MPHRPRDASIRGRLIAEVDRLLRAGRTSEAKQQLERAVVADRGFAEAHLRLNRVLLAEGQADRALAHLLRAAEARRADPALQEQAVVALLTAGRKTQARKLVSGAKLKGPDARRLKDVLAGTALAPEADVARARAGLAAGDAGPLAGLRSVYGEDPDVLTLLSAYSLMRDDLVQAEEDAARADAVRPHDVDTVANLGLARLRQGKIDAALTVLEPWRDHEGATTALLVNLASALLRADRSDEALAVAAPLARETPDDDEIVGVFVAALLAQGRAEEALERVAGRHGLADLEAEAREIANGREDALSFLDGLDDVPEETCYRLAERVGAWGETERAARLVQPYLDQSRDARAARIYALMVKWPPDDPALKAVSRGLEDESLPPRQRGRFGIALAKARRDASDLEGAFDALDAAKLQLARAAPRGAERDVGAVFHSVGAWTKDKVEGLASEGDDSVAPIFVVGLPRTGSTLLETMLSRHPEVHALGESPRLYSRAAAVRDRAEAASVRHVAEDAGFLEAPPPKTRVTDKLLANAEHAGLLAAAFPRACFVEIRRDPRATLLSIYESDLPLSAHPYSTDLALIAQMIGAHERAMAHWEDVLGPRLSRPRYEALTKDPETVMRQLFDALDMSWNPACLSQTHSNRRIETLSVAQVRQPVHTGSVARWRKVAHRLKPGLDVFDRLGLIPADEG